MRSLQRNGARGLRFQWNRFLGLSQVKLPCRRNYVQWTNSSRVLDRWTDHEVLKDWIRERIALFQPDRVHICDGTEKEFQDLITLQIHLGSMIQLNPELRPNSYVVRSDKEDVARLEHKTFICSDSAAEAGPTNNWQDPLDTTNRMNTLFENSMRGRTMYVIPFCMGPLDSDMSYIGVQITDSPYVVTSMKIMTRMGLAVLQKLGTDGDFVPCIHSVGHPLVRGQVDSPWPSNPQKQVVHFPEQRRIWSFGSGYGGNALLGKKCFALRIASAIAREEGWLAEHMLIVGVTNPKGVKKYFAAAFPSACGKTNLSMMAPEIDGWKIECVGDDIAWMRINKKDGRLYAINPEAGFFGVAPGTSYKTNPNAMEGIKKNTIFTNVAITPEGDVWWEGMSKEKPDRLVTWLRTQMTKGDIEDAAHPNARFCAPASQCPVIDPNWENPEGVPISGIIFGGRRSQTVPLVYQARDWQHGTFIGSIMNSETTAAAAGIRGVLRPDPFAMYPFCGYNMADYFSHWLNFASLAPDEKLLPKIFHVNWFKKKSNKFVWPGFGQNIRVLKWIFERTDIENPADGSVVKTPIGYVPTPESIDTSGLDITTEDMKYLLQVDTREWRTEVDIYREFQSKFSKEKFPKRLVHELDLLAKEVAAPATRT
uniref:phosphoenolpyruvate carboxykinase (GTP) n=1 Tax=Hirondellea gigas TaxID=1518452 RepID=A0A6A7FTF1_9CRUS